MTNIPVKVTIHIEDKQILRVHIESSPVFKKSFTGEHAPDLVKLVNEWIDTYLSGKQPNIALPFNFSELKPFATDVLLAMQNISFGEVASYAELAQLAGSPRGARAAGTACRLNPFPFFIPCHRIIKSDGSIGGYNSGLEVKEALLKFESK